MRDNDFYEDDEPVAGLVAAFEAGEKQVTAPPCQGATGYVDFAAGVAPPLSSETNHTNKELAEL